MYLILIYTISVTNKTFTMFKKRKIDRYEVIERYQDNAPCRLKIVYDDGYSETRLLNEHTKLMELKDIPSSWYDDDTTITLPYRARIYTDFSRSGLDKKMINKLKKYYRDNYKVGTLLVSQRNIQFVIDDTKEIVVSALNHYYYEPI